MSKRSSDFERVERDFYPTPLKAVRPLLPYLQRDRIETFVEPCCGDADLIRHLESHGLRCVHRGDIRFGQDARRLTAADCRGAQVIITNPPYRRPEDPERTIRLLHDLIRQFLGLTPAVPFWLLIYSDWTNNQRAATFMKRCSDIVTIGRVRWFAGTDGTSTDNFSWCRFDARHCGVTAFHNNRDDEQAGDQIAFCWLDSHAGDREIRGSTAE